MRYAMILKNKVIGILTEQETEPKWPADSKNNPVIAVPCDETVQIGMVYDPETGEFSEYIPPEREPEPEPEPDPIIETLNIIKEKIQINEDLHSFYDEIMKEVGL